MSAEGKQDRELQIAHVLFMDIVGYSKLPINRQSELLQQLNQIVRATEQFRRAEAANKLVRLPTGDGMALAFFTSPDAPVRCAIEVSQAVGQALPLAVVSQQAGALALQLRMGINSGPVDAVADVNDRSNVAGAGINMAQRVMDCGDAGHILLAKRVADDLNQYEDWQPYLHELGVVEVKHGVRVEVVSFYDGKVGNPELPEKIKRAREEQNALDQRASRIAVRKRSLTVGLLLLVAAALIIGLVTYKITRRSAAATTQTTSAPLPEKSIAVLPFENMSAEKDDAYFADGIQDDVLATLGKIKDLKVIGRASVMIYRGAAIAGKLREVGQALQVSHVLEGSVRRSASRVVVNVELIDTRNDKQVWSQHYDRTLNDAISLQGELAVEIARELRATLTPQEKERIEATPTNNTAAYDAYLRGRALFLAGFRGEFSNFEEAARSFEQAVTLDPSFALAWAYLSCADSMAYWDGADPTPARLAAAKNAVDRAVALDPNLAETHLALGYYRYYGARDFTGALAEFQLAEKSLPNNVDVIMAIAMIQRRLGHWDEHIAVLQRGVELDPRNVELAFVLANAYACKRRFSDALAMSDHILAIEPSNPQVMWFKVGCFWDMGNLEAADEVLANPAAPLHLRGHQALNKHKYAEALDLFTKGLQKAQGQEKIELLFDVARTQQRLGNAAASKAPYELVIQELTQGLSKIDKANSSGPAESHSFLGIVYANMGDAERAVSEGKKGMELQPTSEDPFEGPVREEQMAQIYALLGDADEAIPILKKWIDVSSATDITPGALRIDPIWDPIRNDPRFQELIAEKKS